MRRLIFVFVTLLAALATPIPAEAQFVPVTGSAVTDGAGAKLPSGQICWAPTNANGAPANLQMGGGGQALPLAHCFAVSQGAYSGQVLDLATATPADQCYSVTVKLPSNSTYQLFKCAQPSLAITPANQSWCTPSGCNTDSLPQPETSAPATPAPGTVLITAAGGVIQGSLTVEGAFSAPGLAITDAQVLSALGFTPAKADLSNVNAAAALTNLGAAPASVAGTASAALALAQSAQTKANSSVQKVNGSPPDGTGNVNVTAGTPTSPTGSVAGQIITSGGSGQPVSVAAKFSSRASNGAFVTDLPRVDVTSTSASWFLKSGCANGADPGFVSDSTCAILAAIAYAQTLNTAVKSPQNENLTPIVYFPGGRYSFNGNAVISTNGVSLEGDGSNHSIIVVQNPGPGAAFEWRHVGGDNGKFHVKGLEIIGAGHTSAADGVSLYASGPFDFEDVTISNFGGTALELFDSEKSFFESLELDYNRVSLKEAINCNENYFINFHSLWNGQDDQGFSYNVNAVNGVYPSANTGATLYPDYHSALMMWRDENNHFIGGSIKPLTFEAGVRFEGNTSTYLEGLYLESEGGGINPAIQNVGEGWMSATTSALSATGTTLTVAQGQYNPLLAPTLLDAQDKGSDQPTNFLSAGYQLQPPDYSYGSSSPSSICAGVTGCTITQGTVENVTAEIYGAAANGTANMMLLSRGTTAYAWPSGAIISMQHLANQETVIKDNHIQAIEVPSGYAIGVNNTGTLRGPGAWIHSPAEQDADVILGPVVDGFETLDKGSGAGLGGPNSPQYSNGGGVTIFQGNRWMSGYNGTYPWQGSTLIPVFASADFEGDCQVPTESSLPTYDGQDVFDLGADCQVMVASYPDKNSANGFIVSSSGMQMEPGEGWWGRTFHNNANGGTVGYEFNGHYVMRSLNGGSVDVTAPLNLQGGIMRKIDAYDTSAAVSFTNLELWARVHPPSGGGAYTLPATPFLGETFDLSIDATGYPVSISVPSGSSAAIQYDGLSFGGSISEPGYWFGTTNFVFDGVNWQILNNVLPYLATTAAAGPGMGTGNGLVAPTFSVGSNLESGTVSFTTGATAASGTKGQLLMSVAYGKPLPQPCSAHVIAARQDSSGGSNVASYLADLYADSETDNGFGVYLNGSALPTGTSFSLSLIGSGCNN